MTDHHPDHSKRRDARQELLDDADLPVRRSFARRIVLGVCAAILFVLLTIVVMNIDRDLDFGDSRDGFDDGVTELIAPRPLGDIDAENDGFDLTRDLQPELAQGGWVQIADPRTGRLARQYRCRRLDPNPEGMPRGWLLLEQPELEVYLSDDRVVTLVGDEALVYAPHNLVEIGSVTGNVIVRLFESADGSSVNVRGDEPSLRITTDEANFENFMGEVHCPNWVRITSERIDLPGHDLRLLVNDLDNTIQLFIREFDYIRVVDVQETRREGTAARRHEEINEPAHAHRRASAVSYGSIRESSDVSPVVQRTSSQQPNNSSPERARDVPFYLLTITEDVRILQGDRANRQTATGSQLEAVFSMQTRGVDSALTLHSPGMEAASSAEMHDAPVHDPLAFHELLIALLLAHPGSDVISTSSTDEEALLGPDVTLIRASGPLSIVPLQDVTRRPASAEDASVVLRGEPVQLCDAARHAEATGTTLTYHTDHDEVQLIGDARYPLQLNTPDLQAGGERFHLSQRDGRGAFTGPGWMTHRPKPQQSDLHCAGVNLLAMAARADDTSADPFPSAADDRDPELHITWQEGVELEFSTDGDATGIESGRLKKAVFAGSVNVLTSEFTLDADEMTVTFPADAVDSESIESIHARGKVRVQGVGDESSILCDDLTLNLAQSPDGRSVPTTMHALGNVQAIDDEQIIWADTLHVWFMAPADAQQRSKSSDARWGDEVDVERVEAEGDVQVLLRDGTRAFAEKLTGDGVKETVELTGDDVTIVSDASGSSVIMDQGTRLVLDRKKGTATSPGPGRFRSFPRAITSPERSRQPRPEVDEASMPTEMRIAWHERMHYDSTHNDGAGSIDFRGNVDAESTPSPLERSTMTGGALILEFEHVEGENAETGGQRSVTGHAERRRQLRTMIARQDARLESQVFADAERTGDPVQIFYVAGQHVEYDASTEEAIVVGDGELLIHDLSERAAGAAAQSSFGSRGTTMMAWTRKLEMRRTIDDLYSLTTEGGIELRHRDSGGERTTLTCERLKAVIRREPGGPEIDAHEGESERVAGLDFGGSAQLLRVRGEGGAIIRTDRREVDCDVFDYDVTTGMAILLAAPGRRIAITTTGSPGVMHAEQAVWNMERDSITITRAAGDTPR